jgi:hypothetical protein
MASLASLAALSIPFASSTIDPVHDTEMCNLCGRPPTTSNPVSEGNMEEVRSCWKSIGPLYKALEGHLRCPDGAANHTHCRSIVRSLIPDKEKASSMDAMIRCYPVSQLRQFLESSIGAKSHRRCRGGLLAFLRLLAAGASNGLIVRFHVHFSVCLSSPFFLL